MKKYNKNKRGQWSTPMKIIIAVLVLLVSIYVYNKIVTGSTVILKCNKNGGDCVSGTCNWLTQVPALSDNAAGCKSGQLCCINITLPDTKDPNCEGKKVGDPCRTDESSLYYCGPGLVCMSRCEYCAVVWGDSTLNKVCVAADIPKFKSVNNPSATNKFVCACSKTECTDAMQKAGTCIPGYCPSTKPETYCCLTDPAKHVIPTTSTTTNSGATPSSTTPAKTTTPSTSTTNTAPTYAPATIIPSSTTGVTSDYGFIIAGDEIWFKAYSRIDNTIDKSLVPNNCYLDASNQNLMTCKPNNMYSIPIQIFAYNSANNAKAIEVNADPYVVINSNGAQSTQSKALGTYLGLPVLMKYDPIGGYVSYAETNIVISPSESIEGNVWIIYPGAICLSTECKNVNSDGILRTSAIFSLTIKFQSATT